MRGVGFDWCEVRDVNFMLPAIEDVDWTKPLFSETKFKRNELPSNRGLVSEYSGQSIGSLINV